LIFRLKGEARKEREAKIKNAHLSVVVERPHHRVQFREIFMVDEILDIEAHHGQAHPGEYLLQALQVVILHPVVLTQTDAWNHAGVGREVHDSAPDNLGRGFYILNHQAPPPRSGG
jgi:hypothetical protein